MGLSLYSSKSGSGSIDDEPHHSLAGSARSEILFELKLEVQFHPRIPGASQPRVCTAFRKEVRVTPGISAGCQSRQPAPRPAGQLTGGGMPSALAASTGSQPQTAHEYRMA